MLLPCAILQEVAAVKSITECGIAMIATAHGTDLASLLKNPTLNPLLSGVEVGGMSQQRDMPASAYCLCT